MNQSIVIFWRHRWEGDAKTCGERAEKLQSIVRPDEESRRTGSTGKSAKRDYL